jgi:hypothetical protein
LVIIRLVRLITFSRASSISLKIIDMVDPLGSNGSTPRVPNTNMLAVRAMWKHWCALFVFALGSAGHDADNVFEDPQDPPKGIKDLDPMHTDYAAAKKAQCYAAQYIFATVAEPIINTVRATYAAKYGQGTYRLKELFRILTVECSYVSAATKAMSIRLLANTSDCVRCDHFDVHHRA